MHSETFCCLFIDVLFLAGLLLRTMHASNRRDEEGRYIGRAPRREGRKEIQNGVLAFLVLATTYASLFYFIHVAPNEHTGLPVSWDDGFRCVLSSLLMGMLYLVLGTVILVKMYKPDS